MKNPTVKELIEKLQTLPEDSIVCSMEQIKDGVFEFSTFEIIREFKQQKYLDNNGDFVTGDIVAIY